MKVLSFFFRYTDLTVPTKGVSPSSFVDIPSFNDSIDCGPRVVVCGHIEDSLPTGTYSGFWAVKASDKENVRAKQNDLPNLVILQPQSKYYR
jgi:hypothetical protein